jgi:large-conductance mechanosensitive channel
MIFVFPIPMPIIRFLLIGLVIYLVIRSFRNAVQNNDQENKEYKIKPDGKRISKSIGEYIEYEDVNKKGRNKN